MATWKTNRRKLVCFASSFRVATRQTQKKQYRLTRRWARRITLRLKSLRTRDMVKNAIGGLLVVSCLKCWSATRRSALRRRTRRTAKYSVGSKPLLFPRMCIFHETQSTSSQSTFASFTRVSSAPKACARLICDASDRLGKNGASEIKQHPFFRGVHWDTLRDQPAPFVPELKSITDTSYFPTDELQDVPIRPQAGTLFALFLVSST